MILATWQEIIATAPTSFLLGLFVGWVVSQHYAIVHRREPPATNGGRRDYDKGQSPDDEAA